MEKEPKVSLQRMTSSVYYFKENVADSLEAEEPARSARSKV
jgi:hypothetical protein